MGRRSGGGDCGVLSGEGARRLLGERMTHLEEKMEVTVGVGRWVSVLVRGGGGAEGVWKYWN